MLASSSSHAHRASRASLFLRPTRGALLQTLHAHHTSKCTTSTAGARTPSATTTSPAHVRDRIGVDGRLAHGPVSHAPPHASTPPRAKPGSPAPLAPPLTHDQLEALAAAVSVSGRCVVLTGAGASTESGTPDYRGPAGAYTTGFRPMTHQQFMAGPQARARYWARSFLGWEGFARRRPNATHEGLARLQQRGWVASLITQNVDRLHQAAGAPNVLELHGTTHEVRCTGCGHVSCRHAFQSLLAELNPGAAQLARSLAAPAAPVAPAAPDPAQPSSSASSAAMASSGQWRQALLRAGSAQDAQRPQRAPQQQGQQQEQQQGQQQEQQQQGRVFKTDDGGGRNETAAAAGGIQRTLLGDEGGAEGLAEAETGVRAAAAAASAAQAMQVPVVRPDGDVEIRDAGEGFVVPPCAACGGVLKPDVVFFGDGIPRERAAQALELASSCDLLLAVGTSLQVYSAFRLVEAAKRHGAKVVAINVGATRADGILDGKYEVLAGEAAMKLATHPSLLLPRH